MIKAGSKVRPTLCSPEAAARALWPPPPVLGLDIETTGLSVHVGAKLRLLQLSDGETTCVVDAYETPDLEPLRPILEDRGVLKIAHHAKFDASFLVHDHGIMPEPLFDTMLASQLQGEQEHSLQAVVERHLKRSLSKEERGSGEDWKGELSPEQIEYAGEDARVLVELHAALVRARDNARLGRVAQIEFAALPAVVQMELTGMRIDLEKIEALKETTTKARDRAAVEFQRLLPGWRGFTEIDIFGEERATINLGSPTQVEKAFAALGIRLESTGAAVVEGIDHDAARALL